MTKHKINLDPADKWYTVGLLFDTLDEAGVSWSSQDQMRKLEKQGKLTLAKAPNGTRQVREAHIMEIVKAFSPGGTGQWHYEK